MKKQPQVLCRGKIYSRKICLFCLAFIFMHFFAGAQNKVNGTVTDDQGKPMAGVSVKIKGRQSGTTTRDNGTYELDAPSNAILVFSSVGFDEIEETVGTGRVLSVSMQKAVTDLNEVVVVGYGTVRKKDLTGS